MDTDNDFKIYKMVVKLYYWKYYALDILLASPEFAAEERGEILNYLSRQSLVTRNIPERTEISVPPNVKKWTLQFNFEDNYQTIQSEIDDQVKNLKKAILHFKKKEAKGWLHDYIRNALNKREYPFDTWERSLTAFNAYYHRKQKKLDIAVNYSYINGKDSKKEHFVDSAIHRVEEDIKTAIIFKERAQNGTFPYDENGKWEYRSTFSDIEL